MQRAQFAAPLERMVRGLSSLPGIGRRAAERIALHLAASPAAVVRELCETLVRGREALGICEICGNLSEATPCAICSDSARDSEVVCVVEGPREVAVIERSRAHQGRYHVLGGLLAPLDGVGPEQLRIAPLVERIRAGGVDEVVLVLSPSLEGDATALLLQRDLAPTGVRISRAARGIPAGGSLDHLDEVTLGNAFEGRREMQ